MGSKGGNNHPDLRLFCSKQHISDHILCNLFRWSLSCASGIRALYNHCNNSFLSKGFEALEVRSFSHCRSSVKFKVASVKDRSNWSVNCCKNAINDTVLDVDEFNGNIFRNLISPTSIQRNNPVANLKLALGLDLLFDKGGCIWCRNNRGIIPMGKFWNCTYVIKMSMSANNCPDSSINFFHDGIVRNCPHLYKLKRMHFVNFNIFVNLNSIEPEPHVQNDNIFTYDNRSHVTAHLIVTADCNNSYFSHIFTSYSFLILVNPNP